MWICPNCNEKLEDQFLECWNCQTERPEGKVPLDTTISDNDQEQESVSVPGDLEAGSVIFGQTYPSSLPNQLTHLQDHNSLASELISQYKANYRKANGLIIWSGLYFLVGIISSLIVLTLGITR